MRLLKFALPAILLLVIAAGAVGAQMVPGWSRSKAVQLLNDSPWARHETFTRVVGGVGSGVSGEKEIYNTFYVRFLSARPIREAFARIQQLEYGYDDLKDAQKSRFDLLLRPGLQLDVRRWIVVAVSFRCNDPNEESTVRRFFQKETAETLRNKAFLATERFSQIAVCAYFPPREEEVGAKFIFPRTINGEPAVSASDQEIAFELLDVPGANPQLRSIFSIEDMLVDGMVVY